SGPLPRQRGERLTLRQAHAIQLAGQGSPPIAGDPSPAPPGGDPPPPPGGDPPPPGPGPPVCGSGDGGSRLRMMIGPPNLLRPQTMSWWMSCSPNGRTSMMV